MKKVLSILLSVITVFAFLPCSAQGASAPAPVYNLTVVKSGNSAKISWSVSKGANGYRVYRKTASSKYKVLKNTTAHSYTDKSIGSKTTYYYTVRAYKVVKGKKVFSSLCSAFSFNLSWVRLGGSGVGSRSKSAVNKKYKENASLATKNKYEKTPSVKKPFASGKLHTKTVNNTVSRINYYRWLCGLTSVKYNSSFSPYNQWGAVLMHASGTVSHNIKKKPAGMKDADFKKGNKGISASADSSIGKISGNCWNITSVVKSIDAFVNDAQSYNPTLISHRSAILDPNCSKVSFGGTSSYVALSTFNGASTSNDASYYSFPSAGYYPVQSISPSSLWSIRLGKNISTTSSTSVVLYYKGKAYNVSKIYNTAYYWYSFDFYVPKSLKKEIVSKGTYKSGADIIVKVNGLKKGKSNKGWICYKVKFFKAK